MFKDLYKMVNSKECSKMRTPSILFMKGLYEEPKTFKDYINKFKMIRRWQIVVK